MSLASLATRFQVGHKINQTHGKSWSGAWRSWTCMKQRCLNANCSKYQVYGGRGITICNEWLKFENFYRDMGDRPAGYSIDRINNDGNYEKDNCRWVSISTNSHKPWRIHARN
jgi:hypothetical protein